MDSIEIQGQNYISSKRAAKLTGYAQDYVGQLARAGKVPATRVGRSWYVSEEDILKHAGKPLPEATKTTFTAPKATYQAPTLKSLQSLQIEQKSHNHFKTWNEVQYSSDESDLLPKVSVHKASHNNDVKKGNENIAIPVMRIHSEPILSPQKGKDIDGLMVRSSAIEYPKKSKVKARVPQRTPYALITATTGAALIIVLISLFGSLGVSSEWVLSDSQLSTAYETDFSIILGYFDFIIAEGLRLIGDYFNIINSSIGVFFEAGLNFIKNLLDWVINFINIG